MHCKCLLGIAGTLQGVFCNICRENPVIFTGLQVLQGKSVYEKTPAESLQTFAVCKIKLHISSKLGLIEQITNFLSKNWDYLKNSIPFFLLWLYATAICRVWYSQIKLKSVNFKMVFGSLIFSKLYYYETSVWLVFVYLLEEIKEPKNHFEINWPLGSLTFECFVQI